MACICRHVYQHSILSIETAADTIIRHAITILFTREAALITSIIISARRSAMDHWFRWDWLPSLRSPSHNQDQSIQSRQISEVAGDVQVGQISSSRVALHGTWLFVLHKRPSALRVLQARLNAVQEPQVLVAHCGDCLVRHKVGQECGLRLWIDSTDNKQQQQHDSRDWVFTRHWCQMHKQIRNAKCTN